MAIVFKAPETIQTTLPLVFLGGTIDMNRADRWQDALIQKLDHLPVAFLNPRRDAWDNSWEQSANHPLFREQVAWELKAQEQADLVIYYFQPGTHSPVTLLELGLFHKKALVCCPTGFWRKGNVDLICERYKVPTAPDFDSLLQRIETLFQQVIISAPIQSKDSLS